MSRVGIVNLGCPKNQVDGEIMAATLVNGGYQLESNLENADVVVINTCAFIESAKRESIRTILNIAELKKTGRLKKLVVTGCLAQRYKQELAELMPEVDIFIGTGDFPRIDEILSSPKPKGFYFEHPTFITEEVKPGFRLNSEWPWRSYLKISEGCQKRCSFCAIPLIRGNLKSRSLKSILAEAKLLAASGVKELIIVSHDFTDYGKDLRRKDPTAIETPAKLLRELNEVEGIEWIRILYLYPDGVTDELLQAISESPKVLPYFDMPLQHVNDDILKRMNRKMTRSQVEKVIEKIKRYFPQAVLRTQFIVGFPGETDSQFNEILDFLNQYELDYVGCFTYSQEEKTPAGSMPDQVPDSVKRQRYDCLMKFRRNQHVKIMKKYLNKVLPVRIEGHSKETEFLLEGRFWGQAPEIDPVVLINAGSAPLGELVPVRITDVVEYDLLGHIEGSL